MELPAPFDTFKLEKRAGEYKDFGVSDPTSYPLRGVTYPVNYGEILNYVAEDEALLDVFVGTETDGLCGYIVVRRPELENGEHKVFIHLSEEEYKKILREFKPVIIENTLLSDIEELTRYITRFKQK